MECLVFLKVGLGQMVLIVAVVVIILVMARIVRDRR